MKEVDKTVDFLKGKKRILFLTTSNRWSESKEVPKSSELAFEIASRVGMKVKIIDVTKLKIYPCEGNVSGRFGNNCGVKKAVLKDKRKNPSGCHRCWASINNKDDELWKISKELFKSDAVVFFGSVRWGQMNGFYQKLIERLTWLENRHSTLQEKNILGKIDAGLICIGQNWNGRNVIKTQRNILSYFGFRTPKVLFWNWQYTNDSSDESALSYRSAYAKFSRKVLS